MGGSNNRDNIIELFPEEHLIAHLLLSRIYPYEHKLIYAANIMINVHGKKINNKKYGWLKEKFNHINSLKSPEVLLKLSNRMKEFNKTYIATYQTNEKISNTIREQWKHNTTRKNIHSNAWLDHKNPRFDTNLYEFKHIDGRHIICYQNEIRKIFSCDKVDALISGARKTCKGWIFVGNKYKRVEI